MYHQGGRMKIGYLTFGRDDFGYGLALCADKLKGHDFYRVTPKTAKYVDVLLFSCFWWEHIYLLADFLRRAGIKQGEGPRVIVGGFNTFNPIPFQAYADAVVCGDGEDIITAVAEGKDPGLIWRNAAPLAAFSCVTNNVTRLEVARGCRYKCRFCAVSSLKPYREVDISEIEPLIKHAATKKISAFSPEPTLHSRNAEITELCHRYGKTRLDTDVRLDRIAKRHNDGGLLRCGIEGVSERLRKSVNKGYSNDFIYESVKKAIINKRPGMLFYIILDLPGECAEDFEEFKTLLHRFEDIKGCEDFLLIPSPSVFMPNPHTQMEYDAIHWERDYGTLWRHLFREHIGIGERPWKYMMAERARVFGPTARVLSMLSTRAGDEFFEIERELSQKKIISISGGRVRCSSKRGLIGVLERFGGVEKYTGHRDKASAPWNALRFKPLSSQASAVSVPETLREDRCQDV